MARFPRSALNICNVLRIPRLQAKEGVEDARGDRIAMRIRPARYFLSNRSDELASGTDDGRFSAWYAIRTSRAIRRKGRDSARQKEDQTSSM